MPKPPEDPNANATEPKTVVSKETPGQAAKKAGARRKKKKAGGAPKKKVAPKTSAPKRATRKPSKKTSAPKGKKDTPPEVLPLKEREVKYPKVTSRVCEGDKAITAKMMRDLLGVEPAPKDATKGVETLAGIKVWLTNNLTNRFLYRAKVETLKQDILRRKWKFNGEPFIVGCTGLVLNGQHTGLALLEAVAEWEKDPTKWPDWETEPSMDKLIVFGIEEDDDTVNTMDTCQPRSLADVVGRSAYYRNRPLTLPQLKKLARSTDYGVRLLWKRTGAQMDSIAPYRTHAESLDFIERHPRLIEAVTHVCEEDEKGKITQYAGSAGYAAALIYLMATVKTERENEEGTGYGETSIPNESLVDFSFWDDACKFWVLLASGSADLIQIRQAIGKIQEERGTVTPAEKLAVVVKGWNYWREEGGEVPAESLELDWVTDPDGGVNLAPAIPIVGGIDIGNPS